jgi:hypothetical protein
MKICQPKLSKICPKNVLKNVSQKCPFKKCLFKKCPENVPANVTKNKPNYPETIQKMSGKCPRKCPRRCIRKFARKSSQKVPKKVSQKVLQRIEVNLIICRFLFFKPTHSLQQRPLGSLLALRGSSTASLRFLKSPNFQILFFSKQTSLFPDVYFKTNHSMTVACFKGNLIIFFQNKPNNFQVLLFSKQT